MANRRCFQSITRYLQSVKTLSPLSQTVAHFSSDALNQALTTKPNNYIFVKKINFNPHSALITRQFSSKHSDSEDENIEDADSEDYDSEGEETGSGNGSALSPEDEEKEAAEIGYKVVGPLQESDQAFKDYEPVFAVVQIGSHQFKVSNGDAIYTERLKYCDVNDKLVLNKVLMLGSPTQTIIGRPILPDAAVDAVVEEHALDAKVLIFKKKRRKNYRRTKGHRQELTKLRITNIHGIEKPEKVAPAPLKKEKKEKKKKAEKVAVEA